MDPRLQAAADKILAVMEKHAEGLTSDEQRAAWVRMELVIKDALAEQGIEDI